MDDTYLKDLRAKGFRLTPQRLAILRILEANGGHLTPLQICQQAVQQIPGLTEATVYRNLTFLAEQGMVLAAHVGSGQLVYEIAGHDHHHLICRICGQSCEVEHSLLQDLIQRFYEQTGFQVDTPHVTFFGLCPGCQGK